MKSGNFTSFDGAHLFYRVWNYRADQKSLIVMHRGHEHSGRIEAFAKDPLFAQYNIFAFDQRGLGETKTPVSPRFMDYVRDLDCFVHFIETEYAVKSTDCFIVANSIAGVIVSGWLHDYAPRVAGVAMLAPAFGIKLYVPFAKEAIALMASFKPDFEVPSYVKSKVLTHDVREQEAYDSDPLITRSINGALLVDMLNHGQRLVSDAATIQSSTLILSAEKDYVVKNRLQKEFFVNLRALNKEFKQIGGAYHGLLFESMRNEVYAEIASFASSCFASPIEEPTLAPDRFTIDEYDRMRLLLMPLWKTVGFDIQRVLLPFVGRLSEGMSIGLKYGFDSGASLDYVYENQPKGLGIVGRMVDRGYLNAVGWRGIRQRKVNLVQSLENEMERLFARGELARIFDIAGGVGHYLFDIKEKYPDVEIVVNDFSKHNVELGQNKIAERGIKGMRFTNFDCFDSSTYAMLDFEPNIVVVSGIFELFGDNALTERAIKGIVGLLPEGGLVLYTGQPWHPQLEMIAYVLNSHRGSRWVMRRRSQRELDNLFLLGGFDKQGMLIDDAGIFTVSSARKRGEALKLS